MARRVVAAAVLLCLRLFAASAPACADPLPQSWITVYGDVELAGADGERSWLKGDYGKARFGGGEADGSGDFRVRPHLTEAGLVLQPRLSWALGATIVGVAQDGQQHAVDLSEAFLTYKPMPLGGVHLSGRAGLFWPAVSLEHAGPEWAVRDTVTPSAINSWIGEEVKVVGAEATASALVGNHRLTATGAVFGFNDTAGTLLAFRGWALHDEKATAFGLQRLPPLNDFMTFVQAQRTRPVIELDDRPGYYLKLAWRPPGPFELQAFRYDNRGQPQKVDADLQWGWRTRFGQLAAIWDAGRRTRLIAQALTGTTRMGFPEAGRVWVDTRYRSAFVMATRRIGSGALSARVEAFGTRSRGSELGREDSEHGWATTIAAHRPIGRYAAVFAEALHIDSSRDARRVEEGLDPQQSQTVVRLVLRLRASH
jgi:hypothetical protein